MSHASHPIIKHSITYRPDIDGLRAVAILSVVFYHAFPKCIPGGFVGVDIFFVISGYLISSIVFKEVRAGKYSHARFYARRIKRIFPALIVVLLAILVIGYVILFKDEYQRVGKHIVAGVAFLSNFVLSNEGGYFDVSAESKPLLHLWSLSIEEQFYLFWPLLVVFVWKSGINILTSAASLLILSFLANVLVISSNPSGVFYWPFTRFWELLVGSLLAYMVILNHESAQSVDGARTGGYLKNLGLVLERHRDILSFVGSVLIVISFYVARSGDFPGWWALLPTMGAMALISAGSHAFVNRFILSNRIAIFIGLISYPLYLWHWPLIVFAKQLSLDEAREATILAAILVAAFLSYFTYRFIELPIRVNSSLKALPALLVMLIAVIGLGGYLAYRSELPVRLEEKTANMVSEAINDWEYPIGNLDNYKKMGGFNTLVVNGVPHDKVLFIGDSHIEQYWSRIEFYSKHMGGDFPATVFATYGGCPPLPMVNRRDSGFYCDRFFEHAMGLAQSGEYRTIVIGGFWEGYFGREYQSAGDSIIYGIQGVNRAPLNIGSDLAGHVFQRFSQAIRRLTKEGKRVFVILSNPSSPYFDPKRMINRFTGRILHPTIALDSFKAATEPVTSMLIKASAKSGASIISPLEDLCRNSICSSTTKEGWPIYRDSNHLRSSYARDNAHYLDVVYEVFGPR